MVARAVAYVNSGHETTYILAGLGALFVAYVLAVVLVTNRSDYGTRLKRWAWNLGLVGAVVVAAGGFTLVGLWVAGSDFFLKDRPASTSPQVDFCSAHSCIDNFDNGRGYVVQCADGMWSHSGGIQGACSGHGGEN